MKALPIDAALPDIVSALQRSHAVVIEAPPGAGKTTRVPRALLDAGFAEAGEIVVLQPRRLPARLAAERVADELGEAVGERVGYTVRFEEAAGPRTKIRFVTEGILTRRLLAQPTLPGVAVVVLDELHERHIATDMALALTRRLQTTARPDLKLCVMSATLEAEPVCDFLDGAPSVRSLGRAFDVVIEHEPDESGKPLADQVASAVRRLLREGLDGDVLVFLPGAGEIRRTAAALEALAVSHDLLVLPLHGELPPAEQNRAVRPAGKRKVILSTNVAETSVTIDGVVAVVDSGLARLAAHSPWTGLPTLSVGKISQASAIQRAGRAGRTRPGRALRLYTRHDFESRRGYDVPEVQRLDLADPVLALAALGVRAPADFAWFEPPAPAALAAAGQLLRAIDAIDTSGGLTPTGRELLRFPLHPRLARLVVEGERRGVGEQAAALAALVAERDIGERGRVTFGGPGAGRAYGDDDADLLHRLDRFEEARRQRFGRDALRSLGLDGRATEAVDRARRQIASVVKRAAGKPASQEAVDRALAMATLAGFPDRVARRRAPQAREAVLAKGGTAELGASPPDEMFVAVDVEERAGTGRRAIVRAAVGIEADWLIDVLPQALSETDELTWNPETARVERTSRLACGLLVLDETRRPAPPSPEVTRLLVEAARAAGWKGVFGDDADTINSLSLRLDTLSRALPGEGLPALDDAGLSTLLVAACEGRTSFAELRALGPSGLFAQALPPRAQALLRAEAPEKIRLPGGREPCVHYERDRPPWIESRLQDFFGMSVGPAIARGRVPLTLHLLAPSGRAVQVTQDLQGFWQKHYPAIRRELSRQYPRHAWPEDGATATPPPPKRPR